MPIVIVPIEAAQFYDLMFHNLCYQAVQSWVMNLPVSSATGNPINIIPYKKRVWRIKNSYGESIYNSFQGIRQGNGGGPGLLLCACSKLVRYLRKEGQIMKTTILGETKKLPASIFVDETSILGEVHIEEGLRLKL